MPDAAYLLAVLRQRGYALADNDGKLMVAPASRLTEGETEEIRVHKAALLALLSREPVTPAEWTEADRHAVEVARDWPAEVARFWERQGIEPREGT